MKRSIRHSKIAIQDSLTIVVFLCSVHVASAQEGASWWKSLFQDKTSTVDIAVADSSSTTRPTQPVVESTFEVQAAEESKQNMTADAALPALRIQGAGSYKMQRAEGITALDSAWRTETHPVQGYRVQLYMGSLQDARRIRSQLRQQTDLPIYLTSLAPSYRVCLGDFHNKWAAEKERKQWSDLFPMALAIPMEISISTVSSQ